MGHWSPPAVMRPSRSRFQHAGYAAAGRGRERGLLHLPRGNRQCSQARRTGGGFRACWDSAQALHFTVRDTGCGFDPHAAERSRTDNMHDRIAAVGGTLAVDSDPRTERGYAAAFRTPGPAQPHDGNPPANPLIEGVVSAWSRSRSNAAPIIDTAPNLRCTPLSPKSSHAVWSHRRGCSVGKLPR